MGHDQLMLNAVFVFFVLLDVPANLNKSADCYGMIHDNASAADFCDNSPFHLRKYGERRQNLDIPRLLHFDNMKSFQRME